MTQHANDESTVEFTEEEEEEEFTIVQVGRDGQAIFSDSIADVDFTHHLVEAIQTIPILTNFYACVNCCFPVAPVHHVVNTFYAVRHTNIQVALAFELYDGCIIAEYTHIGELAVIHWQTPVNCRNCGILLSVAALTVFNQMIDQYSSEIPTVILDAANIMVCRCELI